MIGKFYPSWCKDEKRFIVVANQTEGEKSQDKISGLNTGIRLISYMILDLMILALQN